MEVTSPDIVYIQKYHQYFDKDFIKSKEYLCRPDFYNPLIKKSSFYRTPSSAVYNVLQYLTRKSACDKSEIGSKMLNEEAQILNNLNIKGDSFDSYMNNRPGSTGLFNEKGDISKKELKELRKALSTCKTNIYEGVLSFTPEYSEKIVKNKTEAYELLKEVMPKYFKSKGLNPNNMTYFAAYHTNTNHKHCHIIFFEKEPSKYLANGKPANIRFVQKDLNHFKELVAFARPMERDYIYLRDPVLETLKTEVKNQEYQTMLNDVRLVINTKKQYNRLTKEEKTIIDNYAKFIYNHSENYRTNYDKMLLALDKRQDEIINHYKMLNIKPSPYALNFAKSRQVELDERIANLIMKTSKSTPLLNPNFYKKPKNYKDRLTYDTNTIKTNNFISTTIKKAYKNNPNRYNEIKKLPRNSKLNISILIDSYAHVIDSERVWREIEEDKRRIQASIEQDYSRDLSEPK